MVLRKAFKFKLRFKDAARAVPFYRFAGSCRFLWNNALALQIERLEKKKRILSYEEMATKLLRWKKHYPFLKEVPSQALQMLTFCSLRQTYSMLAYLSYNSPLSLVT
jgi:putative transposase